MADKIVIIGNLSGTLISLDKLNGEPNWGQQY